jgi:transcriptional regulator with XRE-family HTH domain
MEKTFQRMTKSKAARRGYVDAEVCNTVAAQIKVMRLRRKWTQGDLAKQLGTTQTVISRLENPAYGKATLQTLLAISGVFDVALSVRFVSFTRFFTSTWAPNIDLLAPESFDEEMRQLPTLPAAYTGSGTVLLKTAQAPNALRELEGNHG